jgi:hypothetical protein
VNTPEALPSLASSLAPSLPTLADAAAPGVLPTPAPAEPGLAEDLTAAASAADRPGAAAIRIVPEAEAGDAAPMPTPSSASASPRRDATSSAAGGPRAGASPAAATDLLAGLGRRFRGPTLRMRFELHTSIARQIFRRDFVYVSQQLHALEASRRVQGLPREDLNEALAAVGRRIDAVRTLLLHGAEQTRDLIRLHGHEHSDVEFARPTVLQATIVSPFARDFMDVLVHADAALGELERAWLLGLIEPTEKGRLAAECRKAVQGVKEVVRQQRQLIGAQVRELNAHRLQDTGGAFPTGEAADDPGIADPASVMAAGDEGLEAAHALIDLVDVGDTLDAPEAHRPSDEFEPPDEPAGQGRADVAIED